MIGYDVRPLIKITPAQSASDRRVQVYNYVVEAVKTLPTSIPDSDLAPIIRRINPNLKGKIRSLFIILSDDLYKPRQQPSGPTDPAGSSAPPPPPAPAPSTQSDTGESESESEEATTPVPPVPNPDRPLKRGASALKGRPPKK